MKLSNRWQDPDSWNFHIEDKNILRRVIDGAPLDIIEGLVLKREWMSCDGETIPPNYDFFIAMHDAYDAQVESGAIVVPEVESKIDTKVWNFAITLYKQDNAYTERLGGLVTAIVLSKVGWVDKSEQERIVFLEGLRKWFKTHDKRKRTINWIMWVFDYFIRKYKSDDYYKTTITFLIDYIIAHESDWQIVDGFSPKNWYPASRGRINDMVHAGMG